MNSLYALILIPAVIGVFAFLIPQDRVRRFLWLVVALHHFVQSLLEAYRMHPVTSVSWVGMDALSAIFLPLTSFLFLMVTIYGIGYVTREPVENAADSEFGAFLKNTPESVFTGSLLLFLSAMSLAILSQHFGLQWMAIEATTLASAPLIYYHQSKRSLEAAWKYLILCSVGIAIALMGIFFIGLAMPTGSGEMFIASLVQQAMHLDHKWLQIAFILMLVGYGTKMGMAPMHTWLPDAHSEAPSPVSALLSGSLLNCAFLGILRLQQVLHASGIAFFSQNLLILFGLLSMGTAAIFLLGQVDYKRMLAYSSVEHMGILTLGIGLGGFGIFGALLHAINHSLTKSMLFLTSGNIHYRFHTKDSTKITGMAKAMPINAILWMTGFLAIVGSPPFGTFLSEFTILKAGITHQQWYVAVLFVFFLILAFIGMTNVFLRMTFGTTTALRRRESGISIYPMVLVSLLILVLGLYIPGWLRNLLMQATHLLGGI